MRILVHCMYYPPEVGGLESHVHHLCRAFAEMGHRVDVVTSCSRPGLPGEETMSGVNVWRTSLASRSPAGWAAHSVTSAARTRALAAGADVVHAQAFSSILPCGLAVAGRAVPLVATLHTSHFLVRAGRPVWRRVLSRLVRWPAYCLAASREIAQVAEDLAPGVAVEALTNGVDTALFRPIERSVGSSTEAPAEPPPAGPGAQRRARLTIVVPRRLFAKNGVEDFVLALPRIREALNGVRAVLVGDGPERGRIEELIRELDLDDTIELLGSRPHEEMPALLASADLAVFPSLMEATSVAALECMSCGVPVAASRVGGLPEIVDDEVGALFEPRSPENLARVVVDLLRDPQLKARGRAARRRVVARWSNERLARRHLEIYGALIAGHRPSPTPTSESKTDVSY